MPEVKIKRNPSQISDEAAQKIAKALQVIVARALTVPGHKEAQLTKDDIEVGITDHGPLDINTLDLQIVVIANDYPERKQNLAERTAQIVKDLKAYAETLIGFRLTENQTFVWVLLSPAAFEKF